MSKSNNNIPKVVLESGIEVDPLYTENDVLQSGSAAEIGNPGARADIEMRANPCN